MSLTGKPLPSDPPPWLICQFRAATIPKGSVVGVGRCRSPSIAQSNISNPIERHSADGTGLTGPKDSTEYIAGSIRKHVLKMEAGRSEQAATSRGFSGAHSPWTHFKHVMDAQRRTYTFR